MAREVERKFLVANGDWRKAAGPGTTISQFYLAVAEERSVRVRIRNGESATLTLKFGGAARERDEFEYPIPVEEARQLERFAIGVLIEKTRHVVVHDGREWEVDLFKRALAGLAVAEIETEDDITDAALPPWVGREITGEAEFYNASLALRGLPEALRWRSG